MTEQVNGQKVIGHILTEKEASPRDISGVLAGGGGRGIVEFAEKQKNRNDMAQLMVAYQDQSQVYIGKQVAPVKPVNNIIGKSRVMSEATMYNRPDTLMSKTSKPKLVDWADSQVDFDLSGRALGIYMSNTDRDLAIHEYGSVAKWMKINVMVLKRMMTLDRELHIADLYQTQSNFATGFYGTLGAGSWSSNPLWSNSSSTPKSDAITASDTLLAACDTMVIPHNVFRNLQTHPALKAELAVGGPKRKGMDARITVDVLKAYFDVTNIFVGSARYNSTPESTATLSRIWADYVTFMHLGGAIGGDELEPSFVRTLQLSSQHFAPNVEGWSVKTVEENVAGFAGGTYLFVGYWADEKIFAQKAGYSLKVL